MTPIFYDEMKNYILLIAIVLIFSLPIVVESRPFVCGRVGKEYRCIQLTMMDVTSCNSSSCKITTKPKHWIREHKNKNNEEIYECKCIRDFDEKRKNKKEKR